MQDNLRRYAEIDGKDVNADLRRRQAHWEKWAEELRPARGAAEFDAPLDWGDVTGGHKVVSLNFKDVTLIVPMIKSDFNEPIL